MAVLDHLTSLGQGETGSPTDVEDTAGLHDEKANTFSRKDYAIPAMKDIIKCAYFNYQQEKVFFRTDKNVKRSVVRKRRASRTKEKANTIVHCSQPRQCPRCGSPQIAQRSGDPTAKLLRDVKFSKGGVKRWLVKYETHRYNCLSCDVTFYSPDYPTGQRHSGRGLAVWAVYQHVALSQSFDAIARSMYDLFHYSFTNGVPYHAQCQLARCYETTERSLLSRLCSSTMVCADEAKIEIRRHGTSYVWVFSGPEIVIYRFSKSRDATLLNEVLNGFGGVLVSDFYSAYDSPKCPQQKCLVHLTRDINDDLLKSPFDEELKGIASRFTSLMAPIIETIDRYGLKKLAPPQVHQGLRPLLQVGGGSAFHIEGC